MELYFKIFCYLSFLLILGTVVRGKIKIFQNLFIPASVIGGFIGLILGPELLGQYVQIIPTLWTKEISKIPGILIIPVIAAIPLGMDFNIKERKNKIKDIVNTTIILYIVTFIQIALGYLINFIFTKYLKVSLYTTFGAELNTGFAGGHGTAGLIGSVLKDMQLNYWNISQGIATTIATFGLIGGIIIGIILINCNKKGNTSRIKSTKHIPLDLKQGFIKTIDKQPVFGRETTLPSSIDTLAFHLGIILSVCGLAYIILDLIKKFKIPVLSSLSVWAFSMIIMFIIWKFMKKKSLQWIIDTKIKGKISAVFTEFAVVSAISSLPLKAVFTYLYPLIVMIICGFFITWWIIKTLCKKYFSNNYSFERAISMMGTSFGVFFTGILLLRICDPEFKLPVLSDYSIAFSLTALIGPILILSSINLSLKYDPLTTVVIFIFLTIISILLLAYINRTQK